MRQSKIDSSALSLSLGNEKVVVERSSVYRWLERFATQRTLAALEDQRGQGRPLRWNEELASLMESALAQPPLRLGYHANSWTVPLLQAFLAVYHLEQEVSTSTLRRHLKASGYVWKRFCYVLEPDPEAEKKRRIMRQIRALPTSTQVLAQDETDLLLFPPLRSGWARRDQTATVLISGANARRTVSGALHLRTGHLLCLEQTRKRAQEFQEFLDFLRWHYHAWPLALLLDENPSHTDEESQSLAEELDIQLLWLPKRSPHLNPLDQLWGDGKREVCANAQQASITVQTQYFIQYYQTLSPTELLRRAGLLSSNLWLHHLSHL